MKKIQNELKRLLCMPQSFSAKSFIFWGLNGDLNNDYLDLQLKDFKERMVFNVIIMPFMGIEQEYLSDEYFEKIIFICKKAKELGLFIWFWDDYNWPSGVAGGKLLREAPEFNNRFLYYYKIEISSQKEKPCSFKFLDGEVLFCRLFNKKGDLVMDLKNLIGNSNVLSFIPPAGDFYLVCFLEKFSQTIMDNVSGSRWSRYEKGYIDILNKKAVNKFIEINYEPYKKYLKEFFKTTIKGFFTDEPAMICDLELWNKMYEFSRLDAKEETFGRMDRDLPVFPWTNGFFEKFFDEYHYDLLNNLGKLVLPFSGFEKVRVDFWNLISNLYKDNYFKQVQNWCYENGLMFIGHLYEEEPLERQVKYEADFYKSQEHLDFVGIDHIWTSFGFEKGEFLKDKLASSLGHYNGKDIICETFSGYYYSLNFSSGRNILEWLISMGVNLIAPMPAIYTLQGFRKRGNLPAFSRQVPWWVFYYEFNKYICTLSSFLDLGVHKAEYAVLFPSSSMFAAVDFENSTNIWKKFKDAFEYSCLSLINNSYDFDFFFEDYIENIRIENKKLRVSHETFDAVIVPVFCFANNAVFNFIERIISESIPCILLVDNVFESKYVGAKGCLTINFEHLSKSDFQFNFDQVISGLDTNKTVDLKVINLCTGFEPPIFPKISHVVREVDGSLICFYKNLTKQKLLTSMLPAKFKKTYILDLITKELLEVKPSYDNSFEIGFEPYESKLLVFSSNELFGAKYYEKKQNPIISWDERVEFLLQTSKPNAYKLKNFELLIDRRFVPLWDSKIPQNFKANKEYRIKSNFNLLCHISKLRIVFEKAYFKDFVLNGEYINSEMERFEYFDISQASLDISEYIRFGLNTIEFTYEVPDYEKNIRNNSWLEHCLYADPLIENIFIIGDILCLKNGIIDGTNTIFLGDLCKQGFEYYSGMATFSKYFLLSDDKVKRIKNIEVETLCNDAFSISINSYPEKISIFSPTIFKINGELTPGSNILNLKIANTLANVIEDPKPWGIKTIKFF